MFSVWEADAASRRGGWVTIRVYSRVFKRFSVQEVLLVLFEKLSLPDDRKVETQLRRCLVSVLVEYRVTTNARVVNGVCFTRRWKTEVLRLRVSRPRYRGSKTGRSKHVFCFSKHPDGLWDLNTILSQWSVIQWGCGLKRLRFGSDHSAPRILVYVWLYFHVPYACMACGWIELRDS